VSEANRGGDTTYLGRREDEPRDRPLFGIDDLVGGRYRVTRYLGQGASGEVYAARDLELESEVALKALRPRGFAGETSIERFKREILLARRVSHPNVCRIFDLGVHLVEAEKGDRQAVLFLTMELLDGPTLVRRIEERGPYSEADALPVVRQLAAALAAAHEAGVVHRDFKSSNILLVDGPEGERAVVTDFGLARDQKLPSGQSGLTGTGGVLGTPAYMAPEQVEGRRASARTDLYAFGIVIYEMLTGRLPFEGDSPLSVAVKRLHEAPTPIESFRGDLSPRWRAVVRRCLERAPEDRFGDSRELVRALEGEAPALAPRRRRRRLLAALAVVAALATGWTVWRLASGVAEPAAGSVTIDRSSVAVLGLRNATGREDSAWLSSALAEMLSTELGASDAVRAVPGETVARARTDLGLAPADSLGEETLARLRRAVGADWVLLGSYTALGSTPESRLRLDLRLQETGGARDLPLSIEGSEGELFDLVSRAGEALRAALGARLREPGAEALARALLPSSSQAMRFYAEGLEKLRASEPLAARELLEGAVAEDPEAALAWSALARAWADLGYSERARDAARTAFERSARLPRADALLVEARYRLTEGQHERAIEDFRALWRFAPDDLEAGLHLVDALLEAGRGAEALATLEELRALDGPERDDPRVDLAEARAADGLSDFRRALEAASRAAGKAESAGSRTLLARARYEAGIAQRKLGEPEASRLALLDARRLFAESGDRAGVALALMSLANLERAQGRLEEAATLYAEARATFAALGNRQREARAEFSQGLIASSLGDLSGALELYESALAKLREVADRRGAAVALANIGTIHYELGELDASLERQLEALAELRALGDESRVAVALQNVAQIRQDRGELDAARAALDEELEIARRTGDAAVEGYALKGLGDLAAERGELAEAESRLAEAKSRFEAAGLETWKLLTELSEAVLARAAGRLEESERELARLAEAFGRGGMANDRDEAAVQRVRTLVALGRVDDAEKLGRDLLPAASRSDSRRSRHLASLARAELALARGELREARAVLRSDLEESRAAGLAVHQLEIRALLARVAELAGEPGAERERAQVAADARRLGCARIAEEVEGPRLAAKTTTGGV